MKSLVGLFCLLALTAANYEAEDDVLILNSKNFDQAIQDFPYILVEFYAPWCGHCQELAPKYAEAAKQLKESGSSIRLAKVDAPTEVVLQAKHQIKGYPTLVYYRNGIRIPYTSAREVESIVRFVTSNATPLVREILTERELTNAIEEQPVTLVYLEKAGAALNTRVLQMIYDMIQNYARLNFLIVREATLLEKYGNPEASLVVIKRGPNSEVIAYTGSLTSKATLQDFIEENAYPLVFTYTLGEFQRAITRRVPGLFFYENSETSSFRDSFIGLASKYKGQVQFIHLNHKEAEQRFLAQLKVVDVVPGGVYMYDFTRNVQFKLTDELTVENIENFIINFLNNGLTPLAPRPPQKRQVFNGQVFVVTTDNYNEIVKESEQDVLLEFYAPWCGHCKRLAPIYDELAQKLVNQDKILIAKVDATEHHIPDVQIKGYPTVIYFKKGTSPTRIDYNQQREVNSFVKFIEENNSFGWKLQVETQPEQQLEPEFVDDKVFVVTVNNYETWIEKSPKHVLLEFYAPWCGHCKHLAPIYDQLAKEIHTGDLKNTVLIAKVDATVEKLEGYQIRGYPTVKFLKKTPNGTEVIDYSGARTVEAFKSFINQKIAVIHKTEDL